MSKDEWEEFIAGFILVVLIVCIGLVTEWYKLVPLIGLIVWVKYTNQLGNRL